MLKLKLITLSIVLIFPLTILSSDSDILDLSDKSLDDFKSELSKYDTTLVKFFAPWCGHCKRLAPEFAKAATALSTHEPSVPLVKVDCTSDMGKDLCQNFGVTGYPTLKIFKNGEFSSEYNGPRESDGIVKYMKAQVGPASVLYNSFTSLNDKLKASKETIVVGIFSSQSDDLAKKFHKVADALRESVTFAHIHTDSASDGLTDLTHLPTKALSSPTVVLVRASQFANKFEDSYVVYDTNKKLKDWIKSNYHGLVGHRTQTNIEDFDLPLVTVYYDVDYEKNPKRTNYWRNRVLKVAQNYPDVKFAVCDHELFAGELEQFGLEVDSSSKDIVPVIGLRDSESKKYVLKEKFSVSALETFVKDFVSGKLEPYLKSENVPEDNSGPVKVAVAKNFDELVVKNQKDVLIEFYAPWCGHCKKLAPVYEELGTALKDEPNVEIIKMDAVANDVPSPFEVHGFPTIYWYPSNTKEPEKYEGGRSLDNFIQYIAKHSTKELSGYTRDGKKKKEEL